MRKETARVLLKMALWTLPLVVIIGAVIAGILAVAIAAWPDL